MFKRSNSAKPCRIANVFSIVNNGVPTITGVDVPIFMNIEARKNNCRETGKPYFVKAAVVSRVEAAAVKGKVSVSRCDDRVMFRTAGRQRRYWGRSPIKEGNTQGKGKEDIDIHIWKFMKRRILVRFAYWSTVQVLSFSFASINIPPSSIRDFAVLPVFIFMVMSFWFFAQTIGVW